MSEDLYPSTPNQAPSPNVPAPESNPAGDDGLFAVFESLPALETVVTHVILFALVWSVLYSVLCMAYFYFFNIKYHDRESERLKDGYENGYLVALKLWVSNLAALGLALGYYLFRDTAFGFVLGLLTLLGFFVKLFYYDLRLLPEIKTGAGSFWVGVGQTRDTVYSRLTQRAGAGDDKK